MKWILITIMHLIAVSACQAETNPVDLSSIVNLILHGDPHEASDAAFQLRFYGVSGQLEDFVESSFARGTRLSGEVETRLNAAITVLGLVGDEHAARMLSRHLRWQPGNFDDSRPALLYQKYSCAAAMVRIGAPALQAFADVLAESDTDDVNHELEIKLARAGIEAIGSQSLRGRNAVDPRPGMIFAKAYLESAAALNENPKQAARLRKSAEYFAAELKKSK